MRMADESALIDEFFHMPNIFRNDVPGKTGGKILNKENHISIW
jgi:hypothetical protein